MKYFQAAILFLVLIFMLRRISGYDDDSSQMPDMSATMIPGVGF